MLLKMAREYVDPAEKLAAKGASLAEVLQPLRKLSLDDFGRLIFDMPDVSYPGLSKVLPAMAPKEMQIKYTGSEGAESLKRTLPFIRQMETVWTRHTGKPLSGKRVLDFGFGYGRLIRLMYYYTDPDNIFGVDVADEALKLCEEAGIQANFAKSDPVPEKLPVGRKKFDLAYAFSVFTHLAPGSAEASLEAIRKAMNKDGILISTIRPIESWIYLDTLHKTKNAPTRIAEFEKTGFTYVPHPGEMGKTYGNSSIAPGFFTDRGWKLLEYDTYVADPLQVSLILQKK